MADKQVDTTVQPLPPPPPYPYPGHLSSPAPPAGKNDPEAATEMDLEGFSDKAIRRNFMRKVYSILMVQLLLTGAIIACFLFIDSLKK